MSEKIKAALHEMASAARRDLEMVRRELAPRRTGKVFMPGYINPGSPDNSSEAQAIRAIRRLQLRGLKI